MAEKNSKKVTKQIEKLEKQIEELTHEKQELFEQLQRVSADYANFQKRAPRQIADSVAYEKKAVLRSLLPSIDNLEHALSHTSTANRKEALDDLIKGIQLVFEHMLDALKAHGVKQIDAMGHPFDPNLHEAMMRQSDPDKDDDTVLEVYQAGYMIGEQVLRPSKVIVNKIEEEKGESPDAADENNDTEQDS
ncbi:MAG: nucleotide exchange factor GrpE [Planctomycetota bacterium]|nr:MAG: nucleotide exchange factor GrpE [Planctomycetota bacterium]RKY14421.1 MAG: nucleotide exchange factor GrpE [Planctomycetota bacterium]